MGVYHLMGLGRSVGAVTGPLSYLVFRYQRNSEDDHAFFSRSGEQKQRREGNRVGDVQAIVLFTTREIISGKDESNKPFNAYDYVENPRNRVTEGPIVKGGLMRETLEEALKEVLSPLASYGRPSVSVYWCEVDRRDIHSTYARIAQIIASLAGVGNLGKEIWINLTSGNNVTQLALQLATNLSGDVARMYYVQAENEIAEKCMRFTNEEKYWVELPVMPLRLDSLSRAVIEVLDGATLSAKEMFGRLQNHPQYWSLVQPPSQPLFEERLKSLWKEGLLTEKSNDGFVIGPQWELIRPYEELLEEYRREGKSIEQLARSEPWIESQEVSLR